MVETINYPPCAMCNYAPRHYLSIYHRFHEWDGEEGVIENIMTCFELEKEERQHVI
jgi:hypothetical protein